jgi:Flp pilus assembly protein TadD
MSDNDTPQCGEAQMREILEVAAADTMSGVAAIDQALADYPGDARLHFLKGSLLIEGKRFIGAHAAMRRAVELAPEFHLARFQLGLFELTSGEAEAALVTWQPLHALSQDNFLKIFVEGLEHLIADRFEDCIAALREGIERNQENLPLNNDMQLIIARCGELMAGNGSMPAGSSDSEAVSATSLLLGTSRRPRP